MPASRRAGERATIRSPTPRSAHRRCGIPPGRTTRLPEPLCRCDGSTAGSCATPDGRYPGQCAPVRLDDAVHRWSLPTRACSRNPRPAFDETCPWQQTTDSAAIVRASGTRPAARDRFEPPHHSLKMTNPGRYPFSSTKRWAWCPYPIIPAAPPRSCEERRAGYLFVRYPGTTSCGQQPKGARDPSDSDRAAIPSGQMRRKRDRAPEHQVIRPGLVQGGRDSWWYVVAF